MMAQPSFVLSGPAGTVVGDGIQTGYDDVDAAAAALAAGTADVVVGALPFDVRSKAALLTPRSVTFSDALPAWPTTALPAVRIAATLPSPDAHRARIHTVLERLTDPESSLQKVVLARALRLVADGPLDGREILRRLVTQDAEATAYLADLSPAGGRYLGTALVGASPELLVARSGDRVSCQPFAGSAPRSADPQTDAANGAALADSGKNRHEHQLVVDTMRALLEPMCTDLDVAARPQLSRTAALWHLSTPIRGRLRDTSTTAIDLALALHPTPAVGGVPTQDAADLIAHVEGDRGFYAGAVGWCDAHGDGRWVVAIRGAQLSADRLGALAQAGGGIVAESDPDDEVSETTTKFKTILSALGVQQ
ncbi:isochorismate synthase [Mycobacterium sp. CVI_P3]|uniref:isochorismate synthase n=1 Tax=Mycobacterium pinniadriaticum TaxID=2994102 RepID=A0ABT3SMP5_9MYCO|nr:isochorismate synthase [Mycobacterium pinniadriaticum]MCX2934383.1 isochorismate synthase [Mycobacterium pinniadriaticum]MCX2940806.1 isochorismate synthase [Mycobacterium pinniadriaticum]